MLVLAALWDPERPSSAPNASGAALFSTRRVISSKSSAVGMLLRRSVPARPRSLFLSSTSLGLAYIC